MSKALRTHWLWVAILPLLVGCREPLPWRSWEDLTADLYDPAAIARLDRISTDIHTSHDPTGGNQDYNQNFRITSEGWLELVDLRGPGVMTRFWTTGLQPHARIRFLFDGETEPRLATTYGELRAGTAPLPTAFMTSDQLCFYSGFPIPYENRLQIQVENLGYSRNQGKLFFQINSHRLTNYRVSSATFPVPEDVQAVAARLARAKHDLAARPQKAPTSQVKFALPANETRTVWEVDQAGTIQRLRLSFDDWANLTFADRKARLRHVWLNITWEDSTTPSVRVPIGDFSGQMWQPNTLRTLYQTVDDDGFEVRFPMPFRQRARIQLENHGMQSVDGKMQLWWAEEQPETAKGYFHAGWRRSKQYGKPHHVLDATGQGRLAGIFLAVASMDRSFWVLESDETITRDGDVFWRGTGLEDYFNGGWYYRALYHEPLYGLTLKRPFRTVQYRFHLQDAVTFDRRLQMNFERGPEQVSRAVYDSVVYYYLAEPQPHYGDGPDASTQAPPADEFRPQSLMTQLWDYERKADYANAEKLTAHALSTFTFPAEMQAAFEMRLLTYRARAEGADAIRDKLRAYQDATDPVRTMAASLATLLDGETPILFASANKRTLVFLNGQQVCTVRDPTRIELIPVTLEPGDHILAVATAAREWPDWVQVGLRQGDQLIGTDTDWRCAVNPIGDWRMLDYDDHAWNHRFERSKGPPEMEVVPFVQPDPFVDLQSQVNGIRARDLPPGDDTLVVFRKTFTVD